MPRRRIHVDRGGTFTDCILEDRQTGTLRVLKLPSSDDAPLAGIRALLGLEDGAPLPELDVRMGTTVATNALLERKGRRVALAITRGFGDALAIGTQARPELFALEIEKPEPLAEQVLEVDARLAADGTTLCRPDAQALRAELAGLRERGAESLAVTVLHAYACGDLEREIGEIAAPLGFQYVALSHEVAPEQGLCARADTTVLDAHLTPLIRSWADALERELPQSRLLVMQSSGGLAEARRLRGPNAILSGPAGGAVAVAAVAKQAGAAQAIGIDMGGTSTDVCRWAGELERVYEMQVAGVTVRAPAMRVQTVAAGGGSLCRLDGVRLCVGPESAGADPGPLAYGNPRATELTLTDVNLLLGRVVPDRFPLPLEHQRAAARLETLQRELAANGVHRDAFEIAEGFWEIANANMAEAIRRVSVARGHDVREHTLVVFGGAGGQHGCALAERLGITRIVFHPLAGVMSAWGIGLADVSWHGERDAGRVAVGSDVCQQFQNEFASLDADGRAALGADGGAAVATHRLALRYRGSESALELRVDAGTDMTARFHAEHARLFGYSRSTHPIEVVALHTELVLRQAGLEQPATERDRAPAAALVPIRSSRLRHAGRFHEGVPVYEREALGAGSSLDGPALILEETGTIVLDPGFCASVGDDGVIVARPSASSSRAALALRASETEPDPALLEIMGNAFMAIAEQMGEVLRRTAFSTNIRDRLDFSCALFAEDGALIANAPHIPVHLGAMSETVRALLASGVELLPGDAYVSNDPAAGGSHLPDITVVSPVHDDAGRLAFFTASRGHHADVGGITPGSMPAFSRKLEEEGVVLSGLCIARGGELRSEALLRALGLGPFPARDPESNLRDIEAQVAANSSGARLLDALCRRYGHRLVRAYMGFVQDDAAARVRREIATLGEGQHDFADELDDGSPIAVTLDVHAGRMRVDFSGTGPELDDNLNAPRAVTMAAVLYVLRSLVAAPIPLNSGCFEPVDVVIPRGCLLDPGPGRAVSGGNVETSQRVVDVLLGAVGRVAASQGTMNNFSFGGDGFRYYETIAGGAGAGDGFPGASAVHTHMTNTRITDAETLESRFPVRVIRFAIRRGSGGAGRFRGGDGVIREIEFLAAARVSILSQRRTRRPFGLAGGEPGMPGRNSKNGVDVGGRAQFAVAPGDRVCIETPGGGGFGPAASNEAGVLPSR